MPKTDTKDAFGYTSDDMRSFRVAFDTDFDNWQPIAMERKEDMRGITTEEGFWPPEEWASRHAKGQERPCLHEDVLSQYCNQVANKIAANPFGPKVQPEGAEATELDANYIENRLRAIDNKCRASLAYDQAAKDTIQGSYGAWIIDAYQDKPEDPTELEICAVMDPESIVPGYFRKPDASDMRRCWQVERMTRAEFRQRYPKARLADFEPDRFADNYMGRWTPDENTVQVAILWHLKEDEKELALLGTPEGPMEMGMDEIPPDYDQKRIISTRKETTRTVLKTKMSGYEVLEEVEWQDHEIPVILVLGRQKFYNGERVVESLVRKGRTGQMLYDYMITSEQEVVAMTPKFKLIGFEGQFDSNSDWASIFRNVTPYIEVKAVVEPHTGTVLPLPKLERYEPPLQAMEMFKGSILIGIQQAIGISATERKDRVAKSGKALEALDQTEDVATSDFRSSLRVAQERSYRILERMRKKTDPQDTDLPVMDALGKSTLQRPSKAAYEQKYFVGTQKKYDTDEEEAADFARELLAAAKDPSVMWAALPDICRMAGVGPVGEKLATMIEAMQPAEMKAARERFLQGQKDGQPIPPEIEAMVAQMKQALEAINAHAEQLQQENIQLQDEKQAKIVENQGKLEVEKQRGADEIAQEQVRGNNALELQRLKQAGEEALKGLEIELEKVRNVGKELEVQRSLNHEAVENERDRQHESREGDKTRQHESVTQTRDLIAADAQAQREAESRKSE